MVGVAGYYSGLKFGDTIKRKGVWLLQILAGESTHLSLGCTVGACDSGHCVLGRRQLH